MAVKNKNINQLNDAWIAKGQKVADLNAKINSALLDDSFDAQAFSELKKSRDSATEQRDALHNQLDEERRAQEVLNMNDDDKKPLNKHEVSVKDKFVSDFKAMIKGDPKVMAQVTSSKDDSGNAAGLTIPEDIQTTINKLVRQFDSLQQYVNTVSTSVPSGSMVYEKYTDVTPLKDLDDETATIGDNDDPQLTTIKWLIHRYAGITTVTNTLLKDTAENIMAWLSGWIAKKVVVTRNLKIVDAMNASPTKPTIANFNDIIHMINTSVDPAIKATSFLMTNTSGLDVLSQVTDATGKYLLQSDPTQPDRYVIKGKQVVVIGDKFLPNGGTTAKPAYPLYFGDLKQAVTLFDRENMSLLTTNIGGGAFETDQTKIRVIDRFDVEATDKDAFVAGSFTAIANQPAMIVSGTTDAATK
ncbi:phage major capsid protein [Levilactobacillus brevis]